MVGTEGSKENELGIEKLEDACENDSVGEQRTAICIVLSYSHMNSTYAQLQRN